MPGDKILANAYTLAPVPGAMYAVGAVPIFVEIGNDWLTDLQDLRDKASASGARFLMLSHMRGHIADMDAIVEICDEFGITLIEDCAHTMGARWKGVLSGNHAQVACFSTQTYKHMNSGEGGFITTDDEGLPASGHPVGITCFTNGIGQRRAIVFSISSTGRSDCSARMDKLRATILRAQLQKLDRTLPVGRPLRRLESGLKNTPGLTVVERPQHEFFVGSSIQFHADGLRKGGIPDLVGACKSRGVELKWFGADTPAGYTSRYDSWQYFDALPHLPNTLTALTTCDMRAHL